jgi:myb proto-oncogene protein
MFLEKWLFDDGATQCNEDLINMSLEENQQGLF